jgi:hypothetical protein
MPKWLKKLAGWLWTNREDVIAVGKAVKSAKGKKGS